MTLLETRRFACSAVSGKIDSEWLVKINSTTTEGIAARNWWRSKTTNATSNSSSNSDVGETRSGPSRQEQDSYGEEISQMLRHSESNIAAQPSSYYHGRGGGTRQAFHRTGYTRSKNQNRRSGIASQIRSYCGMRGHDKNKCRRLQFCDFCRGQGHTRDTCGTQQVDDRQRTLIKTLTTQQTRNTEILARSLQNILSENLSSKF